MGTTLLKIYLVEDDLLDAEKMRRMLKKAGLPHTLTIFESGEDMMTLLEGTQFKVAPNLIIMDLNLPGQHGLEIIKKIKANEQLKKIPTIVLSGSEKKEDVLDSFKLGAVFLRKSLDEDVINEAINQMRITGIL